LEVTRLVVALPIVQKLSLEKQQLEGEIAFLNKDNVAQHASKNSLEERIATLEEE